MGGMLVLGLVGSVPNPVFSAEPAVVVILGSGTPIPEPRSSGPAVAIVVDGQAYLFDAGAGVVRRAEEAAERRHLLEVFGPKGTAAMTEDLKRAYREDIGIRSLGLEHLDPGGVQVNVHEV